ncbi:MAG: multicopper oxidase domain-containing protein [Polyangiaceae bacterium]
MKRSAPAFVLVLVTVVGIGCSPAEKVGSTSSSPDSGGPTRYPPTGVTKTFDLKAVDARLEVAPGAIYDAWTYDGNVPGPTLDVTAGDRVVVNLQNTTDHPVSVHTHLVEFAQTQDGVDGASVAMPGQTVTYEWITSYAGAVPYHDHADEGIGVARGLVGALVIHAPDEPKANEHVVVLSDFEPQFYVQLPGVADPKTGAIPDAGVFRGAHQYLHVMNGRAYEENIPPFVGKVGERSRWRVVSIGLEAHTFHIHGHRWVDGDGTLTDNIQLAPGTYRSFEFVEDKPGNWLVHCHFPNHMEGGMMARYRVDP